MKNGLFSLIAAGSVAFSVLAYAGEQPEEVLKAVVEVRAIVPENARTARLLGTKRAGNGVVIDSNGHVVTIGYLILEAETIEIVGPDDEVVGATFVGYDHETGFGLLRANTPPEVLPMKLGQSSGVGVGDPVLAASYGGPHSVQGVRVVSRQAFIGYWEYLLEDPIFTAPPHANFGGAALIDRDGRLVGIGSIFTQVVVPGVGAVPGNMFVPIDRLKPILEDLIATGHSSEPSRPWLGLHAEETHGRVIAIRVVSSGPADKAGLQTGDIILEVDKQEVGGLADYYRKVWSLGVAGVDVPLTVLQGARINDIIVHSSDLYQYLRPNPK